MQIEEVGLVLLSLSLCNMQGFNEKLEEKIFLELNNNEFVTPPPPCRDRSVIVKAWIWFFLLYFDLELQ